MFRYWSIKKYGKKLLPTLESRYGIQDYYSPSQIRATVYQCDFSPDFLLLGYILFCDHQSLVRVRKAEFPEVKINNYKREILNFLDSKRYHGYLRVLHQIC